MSRENVEIVRRAWEVVIEGISEGNLAAVFDEGLFAPASTFTPPQEVPGSKTYVGREGMIEFLRAWTEAVLDLRIWPEKIIDAGNDHGVAVMLEAAEGSGIGSVTRISSSSGPESRSNAGPENKPWVAAAKTRVAPASRATRAASQSVPAVSIMSSTRIAAFPWTSPTT